MFKGQCAKVQRIIISKGISESKGSYRMQESASNPVFERSWLQTR